MSLYSDGASTLSAQTKAALQRVVDPADGPKAGDYSFTGALKDENISYFKAAFGAAKDWSLHHIIPQELIRNPGQFGEALRDLTREGLFSIRDGVKNGIWLPNNQEIADASGLALHNDNHRAYSDRVGALVEQIFNETVNKIPRSERVRTNAGYLDALKVFSRDISGLQGALTEELSFAPRKILGIRLPWGHSSIKLSAGDTRTFGGGGGVPELAELRAGSGWKAGLSDYHAANAANSLDELHLRRNAQNLRWSKLVAQIHKAKEIVFEGFTKLEETLGLGKGRALKLAKGLGIAGIAVSVANIAVSAYKDGWDGFTKAIYEEGTGLAIGAVIGVATLGLALAFPVTAPFIAGATLVLGVIGIGFGAYNIFKKLEGVNDSNGSYTATNVVGSDIADVTKFVDGSNGDSSYDDDNDVTPGRDTYLTSSDAAAPVPPPPPPPPLPLAKVEGKTFFAVSEKQLVGTEGDDLIFAYKSGEIRAGDGNDIVFSYGSDLIDGGKGNDWVIALGSKKAITAGGLGRDWVVNFTHGGELYGDLVNSNGDPVADISANADNFWYAPDTTIEDAQHFDVLKFFGIPLTGGDAAAGSVGLALGLETGSLQVASGVLGALNGAAYASGNHVYFDSLVSFITYKFTPYADSADGTRGQLLVGNVFDDFWQAATGGPGFFEKENGDGTKTNLRGIQKIENFDFQSSYWGFGVDGLSRYAGDKAKPAATLNLVFKKGNPLIAFLQLVAALPPVAGSGAAGLEFQLLATFDSVLTLLSAINRAAKAAKWSEGVANDNERACVAREVA